MARIQILELPTQVAGDLVATPFAIVIDEVETAKVIGTTDGVPDILAAELTQSEADAIADRIGARGAILAACTMEVVR